MPIETLTELYAKYREAKIRCDIAEKEKKELGAQLALAMKSLNEMRHVDSDGFVFKLTIPKTRRVIKQEEERLIEILKNKNLQVCIDTKETVNAKNVELAIESGIFPEEIWLGASVEKLAFVSVREGRKRQFGGDVF